MIITRINLQVNTCKLILAMRRYCPFCDRYTDWSVYSNMEVCSTWYRGLYHNVIVRNGKYVDSDYNASIRRHLFCQRSHIVMRREAKDGTFNPALWAPTFPELTAELLEEIRDEVNEALSDKLPLVLSEIVLSFAKHPS